MIRILNTRPQEYAKHFTQDLEEVGFKVISVPLIAFKNLKISGKNLKMNDYQGIFFSSLTGWNFFTTYSMFQNWKDIPVYTLSKSVKKACLKAGFKVGFISKTRSWKGFLAECSVFSSPKKWIHFCSSQTNIVASEFYSKKVHLTNFSLYQPVLPVNAQERLKEQQKNFDWVLFTAGSIVNFFVHCIECLTPEEQQYFKTKVTYCCLGESSYHTFMNQKIFKNQNIKVIYTAHICWDNFVKLLLNNKPKKI